MKVLHVIPSVAPRYGGPSQAVLELCRALAQQQVETEICTTNADGPNRLNVELDAHIQYHGVPCRFSRCDGSEAFKYSRALKRLLADHVRNFQLVHVHGVFSHSTWIAANACRQHRVPYIVRPAGMLEPFNLQQKRARKLVAWHLGLKRAIENAAAIHYTTEQERDLTVQSLGLGRSLVVPNGINESILEATADGAFRRSLGIHPEARVLISLSRLHPQKGLERLLKSFVQLKSSGRLDGWHLIVAGDGESDYVARLRGIAAGTTAEPLIHWTGWLQGKAKLQALGEADLFVLTSFQENFGIGVIEAMACATPVLITPEVGLAPEVGAANAGWIADLDGKSLDLALLEATADSTELARRGDAARRLVRQKFTWRKIAETWRQQYTQLAVSN